MGLGRMGKRSARTVIVVVSGLLFGVAGASSAWALSLQVPPVLNDETRTIPVTGTVRSVIVRTDIGAITIEPGAKHLVRVQETWNFARPTVTSKVDDGVLRVNASCPNEPTSWNKCSTDLTIVVPSEVTVDAFSNFGDITTKRLRGNEKLASDFGDVRALSVSATNVSATTDYGEVMFDLVSAPAKALARSGFGDIAIAVPDGTYAVDAKTGFGDVKVGGIATDDGAPRVISGRSSYGDVAIASR